MHSLSHFLIYNRLTWRMVPIKIVLHSGLAVSYCLCLTISVVHCGSPIFRFIVTIQVGAAAATYYVILNCMTSRQRWYAIDYLLKKGRGTRLITSPLFLNVFASSQLDWHWIILLVLCLLLGFNSYCPSFQKNSSFWFSSTIVLNFLSQHFTIQSLCELMLSSLNNTGSKKLTKE